MMFELCVSVVCLIDRTESSPDESQIVGLVAL